MPEKQTSMTADELNTLIKSTVEGAVAASMEKNKPESPENLAKGAAEAGAGDDPEPIAAIVPQKAPVAVAQKSNPGENFGAIVRSLAGAGGDVRKACNILDKKFGHSDVAKRLDASSKAMTTDSFENGGALIPVQEANEVTELLRGETTFRRAGPNTIPMVSGNMTMTKVKQGSTSYFIGQGEDITASQVKYAQIRMVARKLATLVPINNSLIRYSGPGRQADVNVTGDIVASQAEREDQSFLRDDGVGAEIKGIRDLTPAANVLTGTDISALSNAQAVGAIKGDVRRLKVALVTNKIKMRRAVLFMSFREFYYIQSMVDGNGNVAFPTMVGANPTLEGLPVFVTHEIPTNLGAGTESEIMIADMSYVYLGEGMTLQIDASQEAGYKDGATLVSAFSRDETVIRAISEIDMAVSHVEALAYLDTVKYGA